MDPDVAPVCIIDVDPSSGEFRHNPEKWAEVRDQCPVAWNPRLGGFWMVTDYENVARVEKESDTFAHRFDPNSPDGIDYIGVSGIPRWPGRPAMGMSEDDGDQHLEMRRALNPLFAPRPIKNERATMQAVASWFLDQKIESGSMDFILDYANPVPAVITLRRMGLPVENWELWSHTMHDLLAYSAGSPGQVRAAQAAKLLQTEMAEAALRRRADPREDPTTAIAQLRIDGELLSEEDLARVMWTVTVGGLNTTTGVTGLVLHHLANHPDLRQQLIDHPELYPAATEEFLRYTTIARTATRTVTRDVELGGQKLRRGDKVLFNRHSANLDESHFDRPNEVIFDREENRHLAFGLGQHRCLGSNVGRVMVQVLVSEILNRIPDYTIDEDAILPYDGSPNMMGYLQMPGSFSPGTPTGVPDPFVVHA